MSENMIAIGSDELSATISPLGAELQTLRDGAGRDLLWNGDPAFWTGRAPILFPIVGKLNGDRTLIGGREYELKQHGFARRRRFEVVAADAAGARLRLLADDETRAAYPFDFALELEHRIAGRTLSTTAEVTNSGGEPMPFSIGFHPGFRWPLPFGQPRAEHRIEFAEPEPAAIRRLGPGSGVDPAPLPSPIEGRTLTLADGLFTNDAIIMDRLASRQLRYGAPDGPALEIAWEGLPMLGIWTKPGAPFICIEPWQGLADPEGFEGDFRDKPGVIELAPGQMRRFTVKVTLTGPPIG